MYIIILNVFFVFGYWNSSYFSIILKIVNIFMNSIDISYLLICLSININKESKQWEKEIKIKLKIRKSAPSFEFKDIFSKKYF